jgi:hypothetical protein
MFRYALRFVDGSDAGEAAFVVCVRPGGTILICIRGLLHPMRVLDLIPVEEGSAYDGLLKVAPA